MTVWIWSDLHLGHEAVIKYENRPFEGAPQMSQKLRKSWQEKVKSQDIIINLGDIAFKSNKGDLTKVISNLPGRKWLILGNHDRGHSMAWWRDVGFERVYDFPIIYEKFYILSHEPIYINQSMPYVNIHGHTHSSSSDHKQMVNVSVEKTGYQPIDFELIKDRFKLGHEG